MISLLVFVFFQMIQGGMTCPIACRFLLHSLYHKMATIFYLWVVYNPLAYTSHLHPHILQKLGRRLHAGNQQVIAGTGTGH